MFSKQKIGSNLEVQLGFIVPFIISVIKNKNKNKIKGLKC
jgi:hypothetical protein